MEPHEEEYIRSRIYEHEGKLNSIVCDMSYLKATAATSPVAAVSPDLINSWIKQEVNRKLERLVDKVVSVYDLYCCDRSLSVDEFENKVRKLLLE